MKLTKKIVDKMLEANVKNRNVSQHHVEVLARLMSEGMFIPNNGQTIVVNKSFTWLLDGQHRLLAIRKAGYPVFDIDVTIVQDHDADRVFQTIDCNRRNRTVGTIMAIDGYSNANRVSATIRALAQFAWGMQCVSVGEAKKIYNVIHDEIDRCHVVRECLGTRAPAQVHAGVVNAMLIRPDMKDRIESDWVSVLSNQIPPNRPALSSLLAMIVMKNEHTSLLRFLKTTKALLYPERKCLKIADGEDTKGLRSKNPLGE